MATKSLLDGVASMFGKLSPFSDVEITIKDEAGTTFPPYTVSKTSKLSNVFAKHAAAANKDLSTIHFFHSETKELLLGSMTPQSLSLPDKATILCLPSHSSAAAAAAAVPAPPSPVPNPTSMNLNEKLLLRIRGRRGIENHFKVLPTKSLSAVFDAYCSKLSLDPTVRRFIYDGNLLSPDETSASSSLCSGSLLECVPIVGWFESPQTCSFCGATSSASTVLKTCVGCGVSQYCGKKCQTNSWTLHKLDCKRFKAEIGATICGNCAKPIESDLVKSCGGCLITKYCDQKCQIDDWPEHKDNCDRLSVDISMDSKLTAKLGVKMRLAVEQDQLHDLSTLLFGTDESPILLSHNEICRLVHQVGVCVTPLVFSDTRYDLAVIAAQLALDEEEDDGPPDLISLPSSEVRTLKIQIPDSSPFILACQTKNVSMLKLFLNFHKVAYQLPLVIDTVVLGRTALHTCAVSGFEEGITLLLAHGASFDLKSQPEDLTAMELAVHNQNPKCVEALQRWESRGMDDEEIYNVVNPKVNDFEVD